MASNIELTGLAKDLAARSQSGKPVQIGLIGSEKWAPTSLLAPL